MPFVDRTELETLRESNARMADQLVVFEEMRPHLELAEELRRELVTILESRGDLDAQEIGEQAYMSVLRRKAGEARDEIAARYEQEHRRTLYDRVLGEIATKEGAVISAQVREKVETDPDLAKELQDSARRELAARAKDVVRSEITDEQEAIVAKEAERQIELDHLDVRLSLERELDIAPEQLAGAIQPGDKVELLFDKGKGRRGRVVLTWTRDAKKQEGWVYTSCSDSLMVADQHSTRANIDSNRFVQVATLAHDLSDGSEVLQVNQLAVGLPLVLIQKVGNATKKYPLAYKDPNGDYYDAQKPVQLLGSDFQTRDIVFTNGY